MVKFFERMSNWCENPPHNLAPMVRNLTEKSGSGKNAPEDLQKTKKSAKANNTWGSHVVTHHSTNQARRCLTSEIGRDPVFSMRYGRKQSSCFRETRGPNQGGRPRGHSIKANGEPQTEHSQPVLKKLVSPDSATFFQSLDFAHLVFRGKRLCTGLITKHPGLRGPDFCLFGRLLSIKDLRHV